MEKVQFQSVLITMEFGYCFSIFTALISVGQGTSAIGYAEFGHSCLRPNGDAGDCLDVVYCPQAYAEEDFRRCGPSRRNICCSKAGPANYIESTAPRETRTPKCGRRGTLNTPTVIGGNKSWPWAVFLGSLRGMTCNGVLVDRQWVVTAAHCLNSGRNMNPSITSQLLVRLGDYDLIDPADRKSTNAETDNVLIHPEYEPDQYRHDIALIKLKKPVNVTENVRPICLPVTESVKGDEPRQVGWGSNIPVDNWSFEDFTILKEKKMRLLENNVCAREFSQHISVPALIRTIEKGKLVCAEPMGNQPETCFGDSGSGLTVSNGEIYTLVGVAAYGAGCEKKQILFTPIADNLKWIQSTIYA